MEPDEFDVAIREQIYFEALKEYEADEADSIADEVVAVLIALLLKFKVTSFAELTKKQLTELISQARDKLKSKLFDVSKAFVNRMQTVLSVVLPVSKFSLEYTSGRKITEKDFNGTRGGNKRLWRRITGDFVAGTGHQPLEMLKDFANTSITQLLLVIKRAYADNLSLSETLKLINGTAEANHKDGVVRKLRNQLATVTRTMMQHMKAWLSHELGRLLYDKYQWISTIDSVTTAICQSRHLKIYEYGKGPRPPAHHNCRSVIVGIAGSIANQAPKSFFDWIKRQPARFLRDVLTPAEVEAITSEAAKAADFNAYKNVRKLSPEQFGRRARMITAME